MRIASNGNIGVGTYGTWNSSTPSEALDVYGNINVGGTSYGDITASGNITGSTLVSTGQLRGSSLNLTYGATVNNLVAEQVFPTTRMVVGEIKCNGNSCLLYTSPSPRD